MVLDSSVLLGANSRLVVGGAALGYYKAFWSSWIIAEYARVRTQWVIERAGHDLADRVEMSRRLAASRAKINSAIDRFSRILDSVDYHAAPQADLSWLSDLDDRPIMATALAAHADALVTENVHDFPLGEERNGVLLLNSGAFLTMLYQVRPEAEGALRDYLAT